MVAHLWLGMAVALQSGTPMVTIVAATGTYLHLQHPGAQGQGMRVGQAEAAVWLSIIKRRKWNRTGNYPEWFRVAWISKRQERGNSVGEGGSNPGVKSTFN